MVPHDYLGTLPQQISALGICTLVGIILRYRLGLRKLAVAADQVEVNARQVENANTADMRDHWADEVAALRAERIASEAALRDELRKCEDDCDRRLGIHEARIRALDEELWGEKKQRVAEQISLINVILNTVDAPELKALLRTFESVKTHLGERE